jgi:hypothetical protein
MERDDTNRMLTESIFFGEGIKKIMVACRGRGKEHSEHEH